jgi:hypothetical protein
MADPTGPDSIDPLFTQPYVDVDEWRDVPVRHRYVHGGFADTETRFSMYLPPADVYEGRFSQHITPVPDSEHLAQEATGEQDRIGFAISSGGYFLETNGGGASGRPGASVDPTIAAYRANAASARYSRVVAARMYGEHRPYGYAYGGSGGGYRTIGSAENTSGVWDGFVPYVMGPRWRYRTCSRSACTLSASCATGSIRSSMPWSPVGVTTCSRTSTRRNGMP